MYPSKNHPKTFLIFLFVITEIIGILSTFLCLIWTTSYHGGFGTNDHFQLLNVHAFLMPISSIILTGNGMVLFRLVNICSTKAVRKLHTMLHFLSFFILFGGLVAAVFAKESYNPNLGHMFTFHSWMGFINLTLYAFNLTFSLVIFVCREPEIQDSYAGIHSFIGISNFLLSTATVCAGIAQKTTLFIPNLSSLPNESLLGYASGLGFIIFSANIFYIIVNPFFEWEKITDV